MAEFEYEFERIRIINEFELEFEHSLRLHRISNTNAIIRYSLSNRIRIEFDIRYEYESEYEPLSKKNKYIRIRTYSMIFASIPPLLVPVTQYLPSAHSKNSDCEFP